MKIHIIPCLRLTLITMLLFGTAYPLLVTAIANLSPGGGEGIMLKTKGRIAGFEIIGQSFDSDRYFNGRPSAVHYNAASTGGSNKGPSNPEYLSVVSDRINLLLNKNPQADKRNLPTDLVTASGSGLDPHISYESAMIQVKRVASIRNMKEEALINLIQNQVEPPLFGMLGGSKINVLKLNIALDELR